MSVESNGASRPVVEIRNLSRRFGAAAELRAALLVDPRDVDALAVAYERALGMSRAERRVRMRRLRGCVQRHDVFQWSRELLLAL